MLKTPSTIFKCRHMSVQFICFCWVSDYLSGLIRNHCHLIFESQCCVCLACVWLRDVPASSSWQDTCCHVASPDLLVKERRNVSRTEASTAHIQAWPQKTMVPRYACFRRTLRVNGEFELSNHAFLLCLLKSDIIISLLRSPDRKLLHFHPKFFYDHIPATKYFYCTFTDKCKLRWLQLLGAAKWP